MRALSLDWTKRAPAETKKNYEDAIRNSTLALGRLYEILYEWEDELTAQESKLTDFTDPNWSHKQAYRNGDRSRIRKLRELLSFLQPDRAGGNHG